MEIIKKLQELFSFGLQGKYDNEILNRIVLINLYNLVCVLFSIILGVLSFSDGQYPTFVILSLSMLSFVANFLHLRKTKNYATSSNFLVYIYSLTFIVLLLNPSSSQTSIYMFLMFPVFALILKGLRRGTIFIFVLFAFTLLVFLIPENDLLQIKHDFHAVLLYFSLYVLVYFFTYFYEYLRNETYKTTEKAMLEAQKNIKEKNEFIANLSHQIRTPLNSIFGITSLMNNTSLNDKQQDYIDTIQAAASNLYAVVNSINKVSNMKIDTSTNNNLSFNLYFTISSTLDLFSNRSFDNIKFNFSFSNKIPDKLVGNPVLVKQVFLNLIENFIKNKSTRSLTLDINITAKSETATAVECLFEISSDKPIDISVKSTDHDYSSIIKKGGLQIDSTKHLELLDLSITKDLIESNGGTLRIITGDEKTTYLYTVPLKKEAKKAKELETKIHPEVAPINPPIQSPKTPVELKDACVLLVEDNRINQKMMLLFLKNIVQCIDVVSSGKEALDMFGTKRYDLIFMDVQIPVMDGIKTTIKLREIENSTGTHTPIIAITANALMGDKEDCLKAGMDDYMSKPVQFPELLEKMQYHLNK